MRSFIGYLITGLKETARIRELIIWFTRRGLWKVRQVRKGKLLCGSLRKLCKGVYSLKSIRMLTPQGEGGSSTP